MTPIQGPLALRAMRHQNSRDRGDNFYSPAWHTRWIKAGILNAECERCGDRLPNWNCTCGIYGTFDLLTARTYQMISPNSSAIFLVEATGRWLLYTKGWRAAQAVIHAIVLPKAVDVLSPAGLTAHYAATYFNRRLISTETALEAIKLQQQRV